MQLTKSQMSAEWEANDWTEIQQAIRDLLASRGGRRLLFRWLGFARIGANPFSPQALTMSFACGELNVGQRLLADIMDISPEGWLLMQREMNDEQRSRSDALTSADPD